MIFIWRMPLNTVTPAQSRGAYVAGSALAGMRTVASVRRVQYSASLDASVGLLSLTIAKVRTSTIPGDSIDDFVVTHLEQAAIAGFADSVMPTVPRSAYFVAEFPFLFAVTDCDYGADDFMAGDAGERGAAKISH
jgi:hypothetical protein